MKLVILGAGGMLGTDLRAICEREGIAFEGFDLPEFDITNPGHVGHLPSADWIINCAAYTNVDGAEEHRDLCQAVNAAGPALLAGHCAREGIPLLHISTDYVFDGTKPSPYTEGDPTGPLGVYGAAKLAGEEAIRASGAAYTIARTQSLFGWHGPNFVKAIKRFIEEGKTPLRVVADQVSCPTWTGHLADALIALARSSFRGIVHTSSEGSCSWYEFACAICERVAPGTEVLPVPAATYPRAARRPANSVLEKRIYREITGQTFPHWREALDAYLNSVPAS